MSSYVPPIRRKDSIGLCFSCYPEYNLVCKVIFEILKIDENDLVGFQHMTNNRIIIKFSDPYTFQEFVRENEDKTVNIDKGETVKIVNLSSVYAYVSIRYAPFDMENSTLISVLSQYGKVHSIRMNRHSNGKAEGLLNGIRTARMEIRQNIPSSIKVFGHSVVFLYNGQKRTCHKCGRDTHFAVDCNMENEPKLNVFSMNDFPPMHSVANNDNSPGNDKDNRRKDNNERVYDDAYNKELDETQRSKNKELMRNMEEHNYGDDDNHNNGPEDDGQKTESDDISDNVDNALNDVSLEQKETETGKNTDKMAKCNDAVNVTNAENDDDDEDLDCIRAAPPGINRRFLTPHRR